jgi:hypothetical protein
MEMTPPRISSKDMSRSQPIAGEQVQTGGGKKAEANYKENRVRHIALRSTRE